MKLCRRSLAAPCLGEPALVILAVWLIHHQADRLDQAPWAAHESTVDQRQVMAQKEVEALADLRELCKKGRIFRSRLCRKLQRLRLHRIAAEDGVEGLGQASALNLDWSFLTRLKEGGYHAAEQWQASEARLMA